MAFHCSPPVPCSYLCLVLFTTVSSHYLYTVYLLLESGAEIEADDSLPGPSKLKPMAQTSSINAFTLISSVMKTGESPKFLSDRLAVYL